MTGRRGINLTGIRDHNTALVLSAIRSAGEEGVSQARLAEIAELTPQGISKIIARLAEDDLVVKFGRGVSTGGKPPTILRLRELARWVVGAYLDRDKTTFVLVGLSGSAVSQRTVPVGMKEPRADVLKMFSVQLKALLDQAPGELSMEPAEGMLGVGVACPGPLDQESGVLSGVTHLPHWHGFPLRDALAEHLMVPVDLTKDTDAAARAVHDASGGRNHVYVHLGTGLGAGLILDGKVYHAQHARAGEFGHQTIDLDGPACDCGRRGCLEAVCLEALSRGRPDLAADLLAVGLANLDRLLGIDQVTLGGSVIEGLPAMFRERVGAALAKTIQPEPPQVQIALTDEQLVARGAAARVLDAFLQPLDNGYSVAKAWLSPG
jgi:predicted NBD/HSP70 family sugar kinase